MRIEFALILAIVLVAAFSAVADDWRSKFMTPDGRMNCCGIHDCRITELVPKVGDVFLVNGRVTQITIVHPSEDYSHWVCSTGCAFVAGTS